MKGGCWFLSAGQAEVEAHADVIRHAADLLSAAVGGQAANSHAHARWLKLDGKAHLKSHEKRG